MNNPEVKKLLTKKGYRFESKNNYLDDSVIGFYFKTPDGKDLPNCLLNKRPGNIYVEEWSLQKYLKSQPSHNGFNIGIKGQAPQGWIDFHYYSMNAEELLEKIEEVEAALLRAWKTVFETKGEEK